MVFSLRNAYTIQAAVEFDRKTETLKVFANKLLQYRLLLHRHPLSTVMVVTEKAEDLERLEQGLEGVRNTIPIVTVALPCRHVPRRQRWAVRCRAIPGPRMSARRSY